MYNLPTDQDQIKGGSTVIGLKPQLISVLLITIQFGVQLY